MKRCERAAKGVYIANAIGTLDSEGTFGGENITLGALLGLNLGLGMLSPRPPLQIREHDIRGDRDSEVEEEEDEEEVMNALWSDMSPAYEDRDYSLDNAITFVPGIFQ